MKKFILILLLLTTVYAQNRSKKKATQPSVSKTVVNKIKQTNTESVPRRISYQGLITKADGSPTDDGSYEVTFRVYSTVDGGSPIWTENQEVTVNNGIISTVLGNTNPFTVIPQEAYLELTVDGSILSPRQILTSVFYSVLSDTSAYARTADYDDLIDLPDLDVYVLKDSLDSYTTSSDLFDTLSTYQQIDSNLTDLVEDGILSSSKVEFGITSDGVTGQSWISDGDGSGEWGIPTAIAADDIIIGDTAIVLETTNGGINITPGDNAVVVIDSTVTIDGGTVGIVEDSDLITLSPDTLTVRGGIVAATLSGAAVLDEDDMVSDSDTRLATQQSIKAYIDTKQDADENLETIASLEQTDGAFIVSDGTEWTVESDSIARASLGLGSIATQNINNINIDGGVIDGTTIGAASPAEGNFTNLNASTRAEFGTMTIQSGSILDGNGSISFGTNNLATTGTISAGTGFTPDEADGAHIGTSSSEFSDIFLADGSVINLGDDQDVTLTHVPDDGLKLNGSSQFQFGDSGTQISQSADGVLDLVSDNVVEINGATIDINGDTEITGNTTLDNATIDYVKIDGPYIGHIDDTDLVTLSNGLATVDGEVSLTTLDIGGTDVTSTAEELNILDGVTATATELNYNDVTTLGTSEPSKAITVDANGDLIVPDSDKYMFGTGSDMELYHDGSNSFIANKTGDLNVGTETNGIAVNIGHSTSEVTVGDNFTVAGDAAVTGDVTITGSITANSFSGDGSSITGVQATSIGTLSGTSPIIIEGNSPDDFETTLAVEEPTSDRTITFPNNTGTIITTANDSDIDQVGTITSGVWNGTAIADAYVPDDITLSGATIDNSVIGGTTPAAATATTITANTGIIPDESDGAYLGTSSAQFSDVFLADGAVINLGDEQDVTLTHVEDTGVKLNSSNQLQFGDSGTQISQSADGVLDLVSDNEVEINGTTIDINGAVDISGAIANASTITTAGSVLPASVDGAALGSSSAEFSDVFLADGAVMNLGNNQDVTLTHIEDEGIRLNSLNQLQFGDSGTKISQSADGVLDLVSDNEVEINGTTIDINGNTELENATIDYVKIDGTYIGHADDTDLMTLANGTLTVSGTLAATTLTGDGSNLTGISASSILADDISQGNAAVTIGTSLGAVNINPASGSPILLDNTINIDGSLIGHTDDTDLITLENGSVTFTGSTVIPTADVNGGAIDAVTLGTNSAVTQAVIDNVNIDGAVIGHTSDTDLMTLADGSVTFTGSTVIPTADVNGGAIDAVTLGTNSAVTQAVIDNVNIDGA
ncbi:MAG: hypothetical protein CMF40_04825, partial [Legionellales bacterium]|nr:hypothetical protein [Legionellales bacterium]